MVISLPYLSYSTMKIKGYIRDTYSVEQLMYKNAIEVMTWFIQQQQKPLNELNLLNLQQWVWSQIWTLWDVAVTEQNINIKVITSERQRRRSKKPDDDLVY